MYPKSFREQVVVEQVDDELLVLDTRTSIAHYLHPVTAFVWQHADGTRSVNDLVRLVQVHLDADADEEVVWLALDALAEAGLLEDRLAPPAGTQRLSRRDLMRRVATVTAGVAITSLPLSPLYAQSGTNQEQGMKEQQQKQQEQGTKEQQAKNQQEQQQKQQEQGTKEQQAKSQQEQKTKEQGGKEQSSKEKTKPWRPLRP